MTMSSDVAPLPAGATSLRGVVVAHGRVAAALADAVQQITGLGDALVPVSNTDCDRGQLEARIRDAVGEGPAVVFVDMMGGSCMLAAVRQFDAREGVRVVTGVNLAMLLDFVFHRELPAGEAAARAVVAGGDAIRAR